MSTPDYMKILKSTDEDKIEEFVNVKEYYSNQNDDEEDEKPCLTGNYSRRNVLFVFVAIAILICVIYILLNKDIN